MGTYVPSSAAERQKMLAFIGKKTMDDLFTHIPEKVKLNRPLGIPSGLSEMDVCSKMEALAAKNTVFKTLFRGAGAYNHYIPSVVKHIAAKEEFVTAYTPYQAEISQGLLQSIFEYQTMICELTGMDVSNASVYDGATAAAEAALMCRDRGKNKVVISAAVHPQTIQVVKTYCEASGMEVVIIPKKEGLTNIDVLALSLDDSVACVYVQQPNYYGLLEDAAKIGEITHKASAKYIMGVNPISLAILKTPREWDADIAVGEGQPLGMKLAFGGPYLGFMACRESMTRKLPGRIVGETVDTNGKRAFVLTLQAREQHIRREKASSSICSNQALCALTASAYMAAMGPKGIAEVADHCMAKAQYAASEISKIAGFELEYKGDFFNEFVTKCPLPYEDLMSRLEERGILGGYPLKEEENGGILWCVTEVNTKAEIDELVGILKGAI